ncbi:M15 family metallopeptidase [Neobacillus jeddahensis]|uniref:M15 family metallopeptidase n=1 Tax=Neobacillus jeddahensis TaxID=1461580 RepID=UPI00058B58E0|nr:M15 family metallopeptidase [Neobacillus jeddahensis]
MRKKIVIALLLSSALVLFASWDSLYKPFSKKTISTKSSVSDQSVEIEKSSPVNQSNNTNQLAGSRDEDMMVLVNKEHALPDTGRPTDLVYPNVQFIFSEKNEKRMLRKEAAEAIEALFKGAKDDGITLLGVSAYRSYETQKNVFDNYVHRDGQQKAMTYSAVPGHSEHETGLAIDVTGGDGRCAAEDCFGGTNEAQWLAGHAAEYGFIIRYPKGKDSITGYKYEPWHIRYVGKSAAVEIASKGITLEEYMNAVPVNK